MFGIAHCGMLHTIQVDDVILILSPAVGWVAAATLVGRFPKYILLEHCKSVNCVSCLSDVRV